MANRTHRISFVLSFPEGIAPGERSVDNHLLVARDGRGRAVLRGTALAGVLRAAYHALGGEETRWFGRAAGDESDTEAGERSPLVVPDTVLECGAARPRDRTHHQRNRHTGGVLSQGLFSLEACPPGTRARATLWLDDDGQSPDDAVAFLTTIAGILSRGGTLGGSASRGIGRAVVDGDVTHRAYDLAELADLTAYLDDHRSWREGAALERGSPLEAASAGEDLDVTLALAVPRGQDVLVGDGQGVDHEIEPQRVTAADGKELWRLPGSSLRGAFRAWVARLAAREGDPVADSVERHRARARAGEDLKGDDLGWLFVPPKDREGYNVACPVATLFGSLFGAGRIHIADAYASKGADEDGQVRVHVSVDRVTGGACEGMLFDNTVLTGARFTVRMRVRDPSEKEARWLAQTVRAVDMGILRIGSNKSAGRLALVEAPRASGPHAEAFTSIAPFCVEGVTA